MSNDELRELAALYAMDLLEGDELARFESELASNAEARAVVEAYAETADLLALTAEEVDVPVALEDRIFDALPDREVSGEASVVEFPSSPSTGQFSLWFPWGLAAAFAVTSAVLFNQRSDFLDRIAKLDSEVIQLESDGALKNLRIAVLASKLENAPNAQAVAVWNEAQQEGRLTVSQLPAVSDEQDYQLWIIDPNYESPVSAGVFNTNAEGALEYSFTGVESISSINAFALSLETKGGNASPLGPIVMVSE